MRSACNILVGLTLAGSTLAACQNADLLVPASQTAATDDEGRAFTRVGGDEAEPGPLTSEIAYDWFDRIRAANGQARLDLIDEFLTAFPAARRLPVVYEMQGDALAAEQRLGEAADSYERSLVMTRTDITGLPLDTEVPLQLALTRLGAGEADAAIQWLARVSIADRGERVMNGLHWAFANAGDQSESFAGWVASHREAIAPEAPRVTLPGLLEATVGLDPGTEVTLVNFWSPT